VPDFAYIARDMAGQRVTGVLEAPSEREVLTSLLAKSLFPIEVAANAPMSVLGSNRRIKAQLMATVYGQLAALLRSGVPLLRSLTVLHDQSSHRGLKEVLGKVRADVEEGTTLAEAMLRHPKAFSEMATNMVRAGAEGGFLEDALERVATFTEQQEELKSRTVGAMAYPVFLAVVGMLVVTILLVFFVPMFEPLFESLRQQGEMPALTQGLLIVSNTLGSWWGAGFLALVVTGVVTLHRHFQTPEGRITKDRWKLKLPMAGKLFLSMAVSRFCRVLGTLLQNGVPILRSLEISSQAAGNRVIAAAIQSAAENITAGQSLAAPLIKSGYFPRDVVEMIAVAEESNSLDSVLVNIADGLDRRTWRQLDLLVRFLEPIMLLLLAVIVLLVALSLLMPVMRMSMMVK
jgi:type II secretory pathway component PulF